MTALDDDDFTVARGFPMNGQGRKMVTHPDTGKLVPYWGASDWPLDPPYTGPPEAGERGTWVHNLVYYLLGAQTADGLKDERERLGRVQDALDVLTMLTFGADISTYSRVDNDDGGWSITVHAVTDDRRPLFEWMADGG